MCINILGSGTATAQIWRDNSSREFFCGYFRKRIYANVRDIVMNCRTDNYWSVNMESLPFILQSDLQRTGYLDPPFRYQQHSQLQAASTQQQYQSAVFHQANQASVFQQPKNLAAAFVSHQQPNLIHSSVFQQQQNEADAFMILWKSKYRILFMRPCIRFKRRRFNQCFRKMWKKNLKMGCK